MKIHVAIVCVFLSALIGVGTWAGTSIVKLREDVSAIKAVLGIKDQYAKK